MKNKLMKNKLMKNKLMKNNYTQNGLIKSNNPDNIIMTHSCGFFSNCSMRLFYIWEYFNKNNKLPVVVDSSRSFEWYKPNDRKNDDITFEYFKDYNSIDIDGFNKNTSYHSDTQFTNYQDLDFNLYSPFIKKYFTPSNEINEIVEKIENKYQINIGDINPFVEKYFSLSDEVNSMVLEMEEKYNINYENTISVFYRGNDKITETSIPTYDDIIIKAKEILNKNPNIKFLIQSDETEFIEKIQTEFENTFYFVDEIRHMKKCRNTVDRVYKDKNYEFSKYYLAITIIMSKCKYIICGSGNCSQWIVFFRGNANNICQNLNNKWLDNFE